MTLNCMMIFICILSNAVTIWRLSNCFTINNHGRLISQLALLSFIRKKLYTFTGASIPQKSLAQLPLPSLLFPLSFLLFLSVLQSVCSSFIFCLFTSFCIIISLHKYLIPCLFLCTHNKGFVSSKIIGLPQLQFCQMM